MRMTYLTIWLVNNMFHINPVEKQVKKKGGASRIWAHRDVGQNEKDTTTTLAQYNLKLGKMRRSSL